MHNALFKQLNKDQQKAVVCIDKPSIILAGAGSGKTRVLTHKVQYLIQSCRVPPHDILMITFTNKAAAEMKRRVGGPLGFIGTFHALAVKILRTDGEHIGVSRDFVIYNEQDQHDLIKEIIKNADYLQNYTPASILNKISGAKNQLIGPHEYTTLFKDHVSQAVARVYTQYQKTLSKNKAVDFDDLIMKTVTLLQNHTESGRRWQQRFKYILVDEFQDTNWAQYVLIKLLAQHHAIVTVVGDFSQSIYSWRGAQIQNLEKFKKDFAQTATFHLEHNYRSTQKILNFAYEVIKQNQTHPILQLFTDNSEGDDIIIKQLNNEQYEALFIAEEIQTLKKEISHKTHSSAVLYRTNAQSRVIEEAFLHWGIPYILIGGTRFYERKEIKDILAIARLASNPHDEVAHARIMKLGKRRHTLASTLAHDLNVKKTQIATVDIIDRSLNEISYFALFDKTDPEDISRLENIKELRSVAINYPNLQDFLEQVALVESEYFENEKKKQAPDAVFMMTLHQAKGLEFPYVFIAGVEDGILPHSRAFFDQFDMEEERRLLYVGITRAQKKLYLTHVKKRFIFGRSNYATPSRFLTETDQEF